MEGKDDPGNFINPETTAEMERLEKETSDAIQDYLSICKNEPGYKGYKIGYDRDDFFNNKVMVRVYYETHYVDRKF